MTIEAQRQPLPMSPTCRRPLWTLQAIPVRRRLGVPRRCSRRIGVSPIMGVRARCARPPARISRLPLVFQAHKAMTTAAFSSCRRRKWMARSSCAQAALRAMPCPWIWSARVQPSASGRVGRRLRPRSPRVATWPCSICPSHGSGARARVSGASSPFFPTFSVFNDLDVPVELGLSPVSLMAGDGGATASGSASSAKPASGTAAVLAGTAGVAALAVAGDPPTIIGTLPPNSLVPLNINLHGRLFCLRLPTTYWSRCFAGSARFESRILKLEDAERDGAMRTVCLQCAEFASRRVLRFVEPDSMPPIRVENHCTRTAIEFFQSGQLQRYELLSGEMMSYAFDDPAPTAAEALCFRTPHHKDDQEAVTLHINDSSPQKLPVSHDGDEFEVIVAVMLEESTRVVLVADSIEHLRELNGLPREAEAEAPMVDIFIEWADGVGLSVIDTNPKRSIIPQELAYVTLSGITVLLSHTTNYNKFELGIDDVQLDCALFEVLHPVVLNKSPDNDRKWLQICLVQHLGELGVGRTADWIEYASVLLQPMHLRLEGTYITRLFEWAQHAGIVDGPEDAVHKPSALSNGAAGAATAGATATAAPAEPEQKVYFQAIHLHPIKVTVSVTNLEDLPELFPLRSALSIVSLNEVSCELNSVQVEALMMTPSELTALLSEEYYKRALQFGRSQGVLKSIGSLELLGDPLHSFKAVGAGVKDFFYEPYQATMKNPADFGRGVGIGTAKLGAGIVGSVTGASSKITGALASGLAGLSGDDEYQELRRRRIARGQDGFVGGVKTGFSLLWTGLREGATGVVMQPLQEGRKGGFLGGLKGVGKGVAGLIAKPTGGLVDLVSSSLAGMESEVSGRTVVKRKRSPRVVDVGGLVVPYNRHKAMGAEFLHRQRDLREEYSDIVYISHAIADRGGTSGKCRVFLFTDKLLLMVEATKDLKNVKVVTEVPAHKIVEFNILDGSEPETVKVEVRFSDTGAMEMELDDMAVLGVLARDLTNIIERNTAYYLVSEAKSYFPVPDGRQVREITAQSVVSPEPTGPIGEAVGQVWENERKYFGKWSKKLLPTDRAAWSSRDGQSTFNGLASVVPYPGWKWVDEWHIQMDEDGKFPHDKDGWQYAPDFQGAFSNFKASGGMFDHVRRRRWVRHQRGPTSSLPPSITSFRTLSDSEASSSQA
eukprot:m.43775 g.43775  ORF g.43775 m.43775 type:complete len:1171 (-) comp6172_c0_seq1:176-3688(-)